MADDKPLAELAEIKARADAATPGPWWFDESDLVWRLHGVHAVLPPFMEGFPEQVVNHQILKAPKTGTTYAEYWPNEADAAFIVNARTDVPRLLAAVDAPLKLHGAVPWYCAASDCEHPEPPEDAAEHDDWSDNHTPGSTGITICLLTQIDSYCPECTRLEYDTLEPEGDGDFVSAPCDTRKGILAALTGKAADDG